MEGLEIKLERGDEESLALSRFLRIEKIVSKCNNPNFGYVCKLTKEFPLWTLSKLVPSW